VQRLGDGEEGKGKSFRHFLSRLGPSFKNSGGGEDVDQGGFVTECNDWDTVLVEAEGES